MSTEIISEKKQEDALELFNFLLKKGHRVTLTFNKYRLNGMISVLEIDDLIELKKTIKAGEITKEAYYDKSGMYATTIANGVPVYIYPKDGTAFHGCHIEEVEIDVPAQPARKEMRKIVICGSEP